MCSEKGIYIINFIGCHICNETNRAPDSLLVGEYSKKNVEDEEDDVSKEIISFNRKLYYFVPKIIHTFIKQQTLWFFKIMKQNGFIYATRNATKHNYKSVITLFTQKGNIYNNKIYI